MRFPIIGGSDAGISAALRAHEIDPHAEITALLEDDFPNYSICGLPFYLIGETPDWRTLAHRTEYDGITIRRGDRATGIDTTSKLVEVLSQSSGKITPPYDKLLIGTGASPGQPHIEGWQLPGVFLLHTMADSFAMNHYVETEKPRRAVMLARATSVLRWLMH